MSGIYISGMKMPTSCAICPFMKTNDDLDVEDYRHMYCDFPGIGEFVTDYEASRHPYCPLVELPAQHGRLIDADMLIIDILDRGVDGVQTDDLTEIQQIIADAPTVIPTEEDGFSESMKRWLEAIGMERADKDGAE